MRVIARNWEILIFLNRSNATFNPLLAEVETGEALRDDNLTRATKFLHTYTVGVLLQKNHVSLHYVHKRSKENTAALILYSV